jgi:hypothetical protein
MSNMVSDRDSRVYHMAGNTLTHSVVREAVHCMNEVICIAIVQWSSKAAAKPRAQSRMLRLGSMPILGNLEVALEGAHLI